MSKILNDSPLKEVVCQFHFNFDRNIKSSEYSNYYNSIKNEFPTKNDNYAIKLDLKNSQGQFESSHNQTKDGSFTAINNEKNIILSTISNNFTFNFINNYKNWEIFSKYLLEKTENYNKLFKPKTVKRIGLKYTNIIEFNEEKNIKDVFNIYLNIDNSNLNENIAAYETVTKHFFNEGKDLFIITIKNITRDNKNFFELSLDYILLQEININQINNWLENAHKNISETFKNVITTKYLKRMATHSKLDSK